MPPCVQSTNRRARSAAPNAGPSAYSPGMPLDPIALHGLLARVGWKPQVIPIVAEFFAAEAAHRPIGFDDLREVRRLAVVFWNNTSAAYSADMRDWRTVMALGIARYAWWQVQAQPPSENPALPVRNRFQ